MPEAASSEFGPSSSLLAVPPPAASGIGSAFDVCHVGVVLRAVLLVQGIVALGVLYAASNVAAWAALYGQGSVVALWSVLCWLVASCALKRPLSQLPVPAQWAVAIALGAVCALPGWVVLRASGFVGDTALASTSSSGRGAGWAVAFAPGLAPAASGAAIAALLFYWLRLRAQARLPADTTARLAELQSRIRPHFLFNTLNTAVALVRVDPPRAEAVLEDLAELFRVALSEAGESVSLADEVELARRYLAIEQVRFGPRLDVSWELDAAADGARVPPLLLQPLVENAVRHGIEPAAAGGSLRIRTRVRRGQVIVDIVNSVAGVPSAPGHGIALANVRERLRLMHDVAAQLDARREPGQFRVQIVLPLP